jgi:hypothetical protein
MSPSEALPPTSFYPVLLRECRSAKFAYVNSAVAATAPERVYCNEIVENEDGLRLGDATVTGLAEFYGGAGLGTNAGGARSALVGNASLKGVGPTGLHGRGADFFHSYGGASLWELALDAVWGEVCSVALPYGGVRTTAIATVGSLVPVKFPRSDGPKHTPRAVAYREFAVRPAHFMRAVRASPCSWIMPPGFDTARTKNAVCVLPKLLAKLGLTRYSQSPADDLRLGLEEMHLRVASQIAGARAKRIMHGSLTPSNHALRGEWLDFASASTLGDYGRVEIARGAPDFLTEEKLYENSFTDLFFYLKKYLPIEFGLKGSESDVKWELLRFRRNLAVALERSFLKLTGYSETELRLVPKETRSRLSAAIYEIRSRGNTMRFSMLSTDNDYRPIMDRQTGDFHLNTILSHLSVSNTKNEADAALKPHLADPRLRHELIAASFDAASSINHITASTSTKHNAAFHALRLNSSFEPLYRTVLYPRLDDIVANDESQSLQKLIDSLTAYAKIALVDREMFSPPGDLNAFDDCDPHQPSDDPRLASTRAACLRDLKIEKDLVDRFLLLCKDDTTRSL